MQDDSERITNLGVALMNEGYYHFSFGSFLLSTSHTEGDIDSLLAGIERPPCTTWATCRDAGRRRGP